MNLKKIFKKFNSDFDGDFLAKILIFAATLIGIVCQISILSEHNAVALFSWTQVFSDASKVVPLLLATVGGYFSYTFFLGFKPNKKAIFLSFFFLVISCLIGLVFVYFFKGKNNYLSGIIIFFILGFISSVINSTFIPKFNKKSKTSSGLDFLIPSVLFFLLFLLFLAVFLILTPLIKYTSKNIKVRLNGISYDVSYINDKYVIYGNGEILKNNDSLILEIK